MAEPDRAAVMAAERDAQHRFVAAHYAPRADDYVGSAVHRASADLDALLAIVRRRTPDRVLDLGCGGGHVALGVAPFARTVTAADVTDTMLDAVAAEARARGLLNVTPIHAAAEQLPFPDAAFDAVLSRFSAHHWSDLDAGLREIRRVLRPGGVAIVADTVAPADPVLDTHLQAIELLRDPSHVRDRTVAEWVAALARARFGVATLTHHPLRLDWATWIARTRTPPLAADAIRALVAAAPGTVRAALAVEEDGSFTIPVALFEATPTPP